ncbi:MAG: SUMF1/EgtB/PvdO family nonheme iron enzyme [Spartobacteria bacterium]
MLGIIGRGGYGEIWLARSLTGALRAVKVVYRATFESERAFNREFEGMSAFEPISRAHDGFVDILHVGRSVAGGFFYYVMELADDQVSGAEIEVTRYAPKTLKAELGHTLPVRECLRLGLLLADALGALHRAGLAHRDIKPSNIIFVQGDPKLADIGLVATSGQRSFVGTEGYVPPEGPGTPQADIYSLGKVLYEISMGKDRLDFPELNSDLDEREDKAHLLQLNEVLLKACAHSPARRYQSAGELRSDLARIEAGAPRRRRWSLIIPLLLALLLVVAGVIWTARHFETRKFIPAGPATAIISTAPAGAMVVLDDRMERSPATFRQLAPGQHALRLMLPDYDPIELEMNFAPSQTWQPAVFQLLRSKGSTQMTSIPPGAEFELRRAGEPARRGKTPALLGDLPTGLYEVVAKEADWEIKDTLEIKRGEVTLKTFHFANGSVKIISAPAGATVSLGGKELGQTPLLLDEVKPGEVSYQLALTGFKAAAVQGKVRPNEQTFLAARLDKKLSPVRGEVWQNSIGIRFLPIGDWHMSAWETRVRDWAIFCTATNRPLIKADFAQSETDPVVRVNWSDAVEFCRWLTEKERRENFLDETESYRLPSDQEWSEAAGLPNESGATPEERDGRVRDQFPWGSSWPPPKGAGNYAALEGRNDGFTATAPAGSFAPNAAGIYDLGGNVWEWCADLYKPGSRWGVLRGGSWANKQRAELLTSYRNVVDRSERDVIYGFRCVLVSEPE